jgi:hypothetical protein
MITFQTIRNEAYRIMCVCADIALHTPRKMRKTCQGHTLKALKCSEVSFMVDESTPVNKETAQKYAYASNCQIPANSCLTGKNWRISKLLLLCWQLWTFCRCNNRSNGKDLDSYSGGVSYNFRQGIGNPDSYFPQLLHANAGIVPQFGHYHFRPNPFQFTYHRPVRCYIER